MKQKYTLSIADLQISIISDAPAEEVEKVGMILDRKMREIYLKSRCPKTEAALLCAMDFAADRMSLQAQISELDERCEKYALVLEGLKERNSDQLSELERLRSENEVLRSLLAKDAGDAGDRVAPDPISPAAFFAEVADAQFDESGDELGDEDGEDDPSTAGEFVEDAAEEADEEFFEEFDEEFDEEVDEEIVEEFDEEVDEETVEEEPVEEVAEEIADEIAEEIIEEEIAEEEIVEEVPEEPTEAVAEAPVEAPAAEQPAETPVETPVEVPAEVPAEPAPRLRSRVSAMFRELNFGNMNNSN
jgi:hypothetical protein